jgi:large subunit ribosomal protein L17
MRHKKKNNHLGRTASHRKAMLKNMASSLILHKRIKTTVAKAKELRMYVEPLITRSKEDTTHSRRMVFRKLQNKEAVTELFREISVKVADRPGGYTRILKTGRRLGDNAEMCIIELVDFNEVMLANNESKKKSTRRRRGSKKAETVASTPKEEAKEAVVEEAQVVEETSETPKAEAPKEESKADDSKDQESEK